VADSTAFILLMLQYIFLATYLSILLKKNLKWFPYVIFVWAAVVAYSRIYLGVHFPIDILVGAFVGSLLGVVLVRSPKK
jgi:undecaprenyl-diphosphatase